MNWKLIASTLAFGTLAAMVPACAADSSANEQDTEEAATSEDELHSYSAALVGAYHGDFNKTPPTFSGIVFKDDGTYFADLDTGIRCVMAPCPSHARLEGRYYATRNYLRLLGTSDNDMSDSSLGWYRYTKQGEKFTMARPWGKTKWAQSFASELSYCAQPSDCGGQMLMVPACVGQWTCGQNQCGWDCGMPTETVWPTDATKVVAHSSGGGFTPPPAPGSTCAMGARTFSLDLASGKLDWERCNFIDWNSPMTMEKGSRVLTTSEIDDVKLAGLKLEIPKTQMCGADKPWMEVTFSSPSGGEEHYVDSFYSCNGGGLKYVDNIDELFSAMNAVAHP